MDVLYFCYCVSKVQIPREQDNVQAVCVFYSLLGEELDKALSFVNIHQYSQIFQIVVLYHN